MALVDFSTYQKQDVDVPFSVGNGSKRFVLSRVLSQNKIAIRRYETYPFGTTDFVSGVYLTGDVIVVLPSPSKSYASIDFVSYSGGDYKVMGFNTDGKYIGYGSMSARADASIRRMRLDLPSLKYLYFEQAMEYLVVAIGTDEVSKRHVEDIREISDLAKFLEPSGRIRVAGKRRSSR